jgi:SAM-dependent methyltransferase
MCPVPAEYSVLAQVYDEIGMADYARQMTPRLIDYAQGVDWLGRRIAVMGCGTGASVEYLSQYSFNVFGIDQSPEMLAVAQQKITDSGVSVRWVQSDVRVALGITVSVDLVLALNLINDLNNLRDLESVFTNVFTGLDPGKLFMFDLMTVQGLAEEGESGDRLLYNSPTRLTAFVSNDFDYERQTHVADDLIFRKQPDGWVRSEAKRVARAFPMQAIVSLLQRCGFSLNALLNAKMELFDPAKSRASRVIFVAQKPE